MTDNAQSDKQENSTVVETLAMRDLAELKQSILDMSHPNIKSVLRELAEAKRYDKRVCDALGMKTVDPEEALNVIDGLRERLRAAEQDAARYRWLVKICDPQVMTNTFYDHYTVNFGKAIEVPIKLNHDICAEPPSASECVDAAMRDGEGPEKDKDKLRSNE